MLKAILTVATALSLSACVGWAEETGVIRIPGISASELAQKREPLFIGRSKQRNLEIVLSVLDTGKPPILEEVELIFVKGTDLSVLTSVVVETEESVGDQPVTSHYGQTEDIRANTRISGNSALVPGSNTIVVHLEVRDDAALDKSVEIEKLQLSFGRDGRLFLEPQERFAYRPAVVLRAAGQDDCDTYRIPGIITTGKGTLIAVYDNRYHNSKDLQEDIDIGMSRSTDGGQTWEPMRVIMDMGEWGGRSERHNGIGDPAVLYDHTTGTIWVAALWMSGLAPDQRLWVASQPGMSPEETGQLMLTKSTDDGLTWSDPINVTPQVKDPAWQLLLQGPGAGITMNDGTLVFAAQFKADIGAKALDGGRYTCHSTIVYSNDGGLKWQIGTGAKSNTTEAQVVQLPDGSLMLNMRDDRNRSDKGETNGRAVAVTTDMGQTWINHPSSNSALPEPHCMASIIAADRVIEGQMQQVLFFSNPNSKTARTNMTIKTSLDGGLTWPAEFQEELYAPQGFGYSCLTMVNENTVGIVYEGTKKLFFQKVPVKDLLRTK